MQGIFRRVEKKYLLNSRQKDDLMTFLQDQFVEDEHGKSTICNIYFDNNNYELINTSLEKPLYKEKVRLRSYGIPNINSKVFLEIKKKYNGVVGKRRISCALSEVYNYLDNGIYPNCNKQIMKEIDYCFKHYHLEPKVFLAYDREAYYLKNNTDFRITFDSRVRSRTENLRLEAGDSGDFLLDDGNYIMEIKTLGAIPLWFSQVLNDNQIYPTSFSKYGTVYKNLKERDDLYV